MRTTGVRLGLSATVCVLLTFVSPAAAVSFAGLAPAAGNVTSFATGISADGRVVVGYSADWTEIAQRATRWEDGAAAEMPGLTDEGGVALGVSADGSTAVGYSPPGVGTAKAVAWRNGTPYPLGALPNDDGPFALATAASADGSVIVGSSASTLPSGQEAFRWEAGTMVGLGDLAGGTGYSAGLGVSADGTVVVGATSGNTTGAFMWDEVHGMQALNGMGAASLVSDDLQTIIGTGSSSLGQEMVRWKSGSGVMGLGIPAGFYYVDPGDMTPDAGRIVGTMVSTSGAVPFLWTESAGYRNLEDILTASGIDLGGWQLQTASGISADGRTIVGTGFDPDGTRQAWIAVIPEPSTALLLGAGLLALAGTRRATASSARA
jgi:probable HAF family extracellular repeat protein